MERTPSETAEAEIEAENARAGEAADATPPGAGTRSPNKAENHKAEKPDRSPAAPPPEPSRKAASEPPDGNRTDERAANKVFSVKPLGRRLYMTGKAFRQLLFSSLSRRIIFLNLSALAVLLSGILYLNQFREGLVEAYKDSLVAQGKIIAGAIASSATVETNAITVDPDKLLELQAGESARPTISSLEELSSPIDPEVVAPLLRSLIQPTRTRARIYDQDGVLILDSKFLYASGQVLRYDLPSLGEEDESEGMISRIGNFLNRLLQRRDLPPYKEYPNSGINYPEVVSALTGAPSTVVRMTEKGEQVISVAVPIQKLRVVSGVLLLSSEGNEIDRIVTEERLAILRIFLVAAIVLIVLSLLLAGTIATPLRRLSEAANRVRRGVKSREEIPDFSHRSDEIGTLAASVRAMTNALYSRIEAIEKFAADVSHELKNPLTSLRSAVETLPLARTDAAKQQLHEVIQHDVKRLDRLITDISDASRLDAELARERAADFDLARLTGDIVSMMRDMAETTPGTGPAIRFDTMAPEQGEESFKVNGHEDRLAQVIINLVDNARSFVPERNGEITVALARTGDTIELTVEDNGPGIPAGKVERIFERFYTDRPESQGFGQNSGLGLSISRQIIEAHGGTIRATNRSGGATGACFIVRLPVAAKAPARRRNGKRNDAGK